MRILHIASGDFFSTYGGGQVYVKNVVDEMIRQDLDITVISASGNQDGVVRKDYNGISLFEIGSPDYLESAIKEAAPDIIHAHSLKNKACLIGKKLGIPVIVTSHHGGILCPAGTYMNCKDEICNKKVNHKDCLSCMLRNVRTGLKYWYPVVKHINPKAYLKVGSFLENKPFIPFITPIGRSAQFIQNKQKQFSDIIRNCSLMIAPCDKIGEAMIINGLDSSKLRVIPHGIPLPNGRPDYPPVHNGKIKFFYVGRICYVKGIHVLLEAFSQINNPAIELHLIGGAGNKHEKSYMTALQRKYKSDSRVVWHGKISPDRVFETTQDFHVSVSPAIYLEAFGLNIAEALALGKPVLSTMSGGGEMQIRDGENGWLVPNNNASVLAEQITYIAFHPEILQAMSKNCHSISIADHCNALMDVYKDVIGHDN